MEAQAKRILMSFCTATPKLKHVITPDYLPAGRTGRLQAGQITRRSGNIKEHRPLLCLQCNACTLLAHLTRSCADHTGLEFRH